MNYVPFVIEKDDDDYRIELLDTNHQVSIYKSNSINDLHQYIKTNEITPVFFRPDRELLKQAKINAWCDLSQDCDSTMTLQSFYAHYGKNICEKEIYMLDDLLMLRRDYLNNKITISELGGFDPIDALKMTEPQLMAKLLNATPSNDNDDEFETPNCIDWKLIPNEVKAFIEKGCQNSLDVDIGNLKVTYGQGGLHGAIDNYECISTGSKKLWLVDVSSMYPTIMTEYNYVSRSATDVSVYRDLIETRIQAKKTNPKLANALKGPLNKTYGAMKSKYNALYDPAMALAVCIAGQLTMTMLLASLAKIKTVKLVQVNTDGVIIEFIQDDENAVLDCLNHWQNQTHLQLEVTGLEYLIQKDVSNYIAEDIDGNPKLKGSIFARGVNDVGAWKINNNMLIISDAVYKHFNSGWSVEDTINSCNDPLMFQIIVNISDKYKSVIHETIKGDVDVGHVNRVFATTDKTLGTLKKIKTNTKEQIANIPTHCMVVNQTMPHIKDVDKSFYIQQAKKIIDSFDCIPVGKESKNMTLKEYEGLNVYQKLNIARKKFLEAKPKKTGWNKYMEFAYYQLEDIVPLQSKIFDELGLLEEFTYSAPVVNIDPRTNETIKTKEALAISYIINTDRPTEQIVFSNAWVDAEPLKGQNNLQTYGSIQTYLRRYNKMQILDLVEVDEVDSAPQNTGNDKASNQTSKPATATERTKIKKELVGNEKPADDVLIEQIKKAMSTLKSEFGKNEKYLDWVKKAPKPNDIKKFTQKQAKDFLHEAATLRVELNTEEHE